MAGGYGYVAQFSSYGFADFTSHPDSSHEVDVDHSQPGNQYNVALEGCTYAYVVGDAGTWVYDISSPTSIDTVGMCATGLTYGIAIQMPYAYVTGNYGLSILSLEDPECPQVVSTLGGLGNMRNVAVWDTLAYMVGENAMHAANVADVFNPVLLGSCQLPACGWDVAIWNGLACIADYQAGLRVVDVSDPTAPTEVGFYDTPGLAHGVTVHNNLICLADGNYFGVYDFSGFASLRILDPNGGEVCSCGDVYSILWTTAGVPGLVSLYLNRNYPGGDWQVISQGILNDGREDLIFTGPASESCRVRIVSDDNPATSDESDNDFSIVRGCLALHPAVLDFGDVPVDSSAVRTFWIVNCGADTLFVDSMISDNPVFIDLTNFAAVIDPYDSTLVGIGFQPPAEQEYVGHFNIYTSAGDSSVLCLGTGVILQAGLPGSSLPTEFALLPAYPNPFNAVTTVGFAVPKASRVTILAYDVLGREVTMIADQEFAAGWQQVSWNCELCASGVYMLVMTARGVQFSQKAMLLR